MKVFKEENAQEMEMPQKMAKFPHIRLELLKS
jgi:hypothetical protein